jgi:subtilisin-like proprotein convertase family protein
MNTRSPVQWIVAILVVTAAAQGSTVFTDSVHIYSGDFNLPIPADSDSSQGWMADAVIEISDHFTIHDLDVGITLTHTNVFDLQIFLQSPAGTRICLNMYDFKNEFSIYPNYTDTVFDDEAENSIKQTDAPFTGRFRPLDPFELSEFDGEQTAGLWRLQICDMWDWDTGALNRFELIIATPEPTTAILLILGLALIRLQNPRP